MTIIASIDPDTRRIYLHADTVGVDLHPIDIYKEMRTMRRTDETLRKYDVFLTAHGNVEKSIGVYTERYVMCMDSTRIVPFDTTQQLVITGTIITDEGTEGLYCFDRTSLTPSSVVDIVYQPPQVEVVTINTGSGLSAEQDIKLTEIHSSTYQVVHVDDSNPVAGDGSPSNPFQSISLAVGFASANFIRALHIHAGITLDADVEGYEVSGISYPVITGGGYSIEGSNFDEVTLAGTTTGSAIYKTCQLNDNYVGLSGEYHNCKLLGDTFTDTDALIIFNQCISGIPGNNRPSITYIGNAVQFAARSWSGGLELKNLVTGTATTVEMVGGEILFDATCTLGAVANVRGTGYMENLGTVEPNVRALINPESIHRGSFTEVYMDMSSSNTGTAFPAGTISTPLNNLTDVLGVCNIQNVATIMLAGDLTLDQDVSGYEFISWRNGKVDLNNQPCMATRFREVKLYGTQNTGSVALVFDTRVENVLNLQGVFEECEFINTVPITVNGEANLRRCTSQLLDSARNFDMSLAGDLHIVDFLGDIDIINGVEGSEVDTLRLDGDVTIAAGCTGGTYSIAGVGILTDNSNGTTVVNKMSNVTDIATATKNAMLGTESFP